MTSGVPSRRPPTPPHQRLRSTLLRARDRPAYKRGRRRGERELYVLVSFERKGVCIRGVVHTAGFLFQEIFNECEKWLKRVFKRTFKTRSYWFGNTSILFLIGSSRNFWRKGCFSLWKFFSIFDWSTKRFLGCFEFFLSWHLKKSN